MADTPKLTDALPTDALKDAGSKLLSLLVQRAAETAADRVTGLTDRLNSVADGSSSVRDALRGRSDDEDDDQDRDDDRDDDGDDDGKGGGLLSGLKDTVGGLFGGGGGGGGGGSKKIKLTQIVEDHDIGLPLRTTYDLWTQFGDFPSFMKKVESVESVSDEKTKWKAQVFLSHRQWEATIVEQVPDSHIVWRSSGAKGHVDGAVTFTDIGSNLTRVMLVLEYYPRGLFERTGNIWRAQGRRARLEFQHFKRHAMTNVLIRQDEVEGWRGEIRDSEVVKTHEEALEEERQAGEDTADDTAADTAAEQEQDERDDADYDDDYEDDDAEDEDYDEADEYDEDSDDEDPDDEDPDDEDPGEDAPDDELDEYEDDELEDDEPDDEPAEEPRRRGRRTAGAGARGRS